jgi:hypothetical protein
MKIVISQPMYFPWIGMFEQVRLSDIFVFYDDVQFSKGSFTNRVQVKYNNKEGFKWLTVPASNLNLGVNINGLKIDHSKNWQGEHLDILKASYEKAPFYNEVKTIVETLFSTKTDSLSDLTIKSMQLVMDYYGFKDKLTISKSSELAINGKSTQRVFDIVKYYNCNVYITGHGAKKYFDHELFDNNGIAVEYIDYKKNEYPQLLGPFNPYVSILDLIANTGKEGIKYINSGTVYWKQFLEQSN